MAEPQHHIVVYRTRACPFCVAAVELLRGKGVEFEEVYLDDHPDRRQFTSKLKSGHKTVPLVVIDGEAIGGYTELQALDDSGELDRRVFGGSAR